MVRGSGMALVALGILHLIVLGADASGEVSGWLAFGQWTLQHWQPFAAQPRAVADGGAAFWSTLGSFAVPTILLGCLVIGLDRHGLAVPRYLGWSLLVWMLLCTVIVEPSGFPAGLVVAACLVIGIRRRQARSATRLQQRGTEP